MTDSSHNSVDFAQRTARDAKDEGDDVELMKALRRAFPYLWIWNDEHATEQMQEGLRDALAGRDVSSAEEEKRTEQSREDERFWKDTGEWQKRLPKRL